MPNTRHGLLNEGAPFDDQGERITAGAIFGVGTGGVGRARCSCHKMSPEPLPSAAARRRWHKEHKVTLSQPTADDIVHGRTADGQFIVRTPRGWWFFETTDGARTRVEMRAAARAAAATGGTVRLGLVGGRQFDATYRNITAYNQRTTVNGDRDG